MIMKKAAYLLFLIFAWTVSMAQDESKTGPVIKFEESTHEFGEIEQGDKVNYIFTFTNTGTEPLILTEVVTTCGCTAPSWSREPVLPGEKGEVQITFNSAHKMGRQNKGITILSNAVNSPARVTITGNVLPKKE